MVFSADDFARYPGYPMDNGVGGILLAIYSVMPDGDGVLEAETLVKAIEEASSDIEDILGMWIYEHFVLYTIQKWFVCQCYFLK